jgi:hypothetical protein
LNPIWISEILFLEKRNGTKVKRIKIAGGIFKRELLMKSFCILSLFFLKSDPNCEEYLLDKKLIPVLLFRALSFLFCAVKPEKLIEVKKKRIM